MGFVGWKGVWVNHTQVASKCIIYKRGWLPGVLIESDFGSSSLKRVSEGGTMPFSSALQVCMTSFSGLKA